MKNKNTVVWILLAIVIALVAFIFSNSLKSREASTHDSDLIVGVISPLVETILGRVPDNFGFIVRKLAHLVEFSVLGVFVYALSYSIKKIWKQNIYGYGCFGVLLVAVMDEFIQIFSGRGSTVSDVLIDLCGALLGFLLSYIVIALYARFENKRTEKE